MIDTIKGATKLKKRVKQNIAKEIVNTNTSIKQGNIPPAAASTVNNISSNATQIINKGVESSTANTDILSDQERIKLEEDLVKLKELLITAGPLSIVTINEKIKLIQTKLEKDKIARGEI